MCPPLFWPKIYQNVLFICIASPWKYFFSIPRTFIKWQKNCLFVAADFYMWNLHKEISLQILFLLSLIKAGLPKSNEISIVHFLFIYKPNYLIIDSIQIFHEEVHFLTPCRVIVAICFEWAELMNMIPRRGEVIKEVRFKCSRRGWRRQHHSRRCSQKHNLILTREQSSLLMW